MINIGNHNKTLRNYYKTETNNRGYSEPYSQFISSLSNNCIWFDFCRLKSELSLFAMLMEIICNNRETFSDQLNEFRIFYTKFIIVAWGWFNNNISSY